MPRIRPITADLLQPTQLRQGTARAEAFGGGEGLEALAGSLQQTASRLNEAAERDDVANVYKETAKAEAHFTLWQQELARTTKPGESISDKFNPEFDRYMDALRTQTTTRRGSETLDVAAARMRGHFAVRNGDTEITLRVEQRKQDASELINSYSNIVLNDPTQGDRLRDSVVAWAQDALGDLPENARRAIITDAQREITKFQVGGLIKLDPELAKRKLTAGEFPLLDADATVALMRNADQEIDARAVDARLAREEARRVKQDEDDKLYDGWLKKMQGGSLRAKEILDSTADPRLKEHMLNALRQRAREGAADAALRGDKKLYIDLFERINLDEDDPRKLRNMGEIRDAAANGTITIPWAENLMGMIRSNEAADGLPQMRRNAIDAHKGRLGVFPGFPLSATQATAIADYQRQLLSEEALLRKANKSPASLYLGDGADNALSIGNRFLPSVGSIKDAAGLPKVGDITRLPDGTEERFLGGNPADAKNYEPVSRTPPIVPMMASERVVTAQRNPRQPGETDAEYRKRLNELTGGRFGE